MRGFEVLFSDEYSQRKVRLCRRVLLQDTHDDKVNSDVELYLNTSGGKPRAGDCISLAVKEVRFQWLCFLLEKEWNSKIFTAPKLRLTCCYWKPQATHFNDYKYAGSLISHLTTSIHIYVSSHHRQLDTPLNTILRVPINVGNLAFHMAADRSYRTQTPTYFRYPFTCSVVNFLTIPEI
jgi:hypothetical protein